VTAARLKTARRMVEGAIMPSQLPQNAAMPGHWRPVEPEAISRH
jgi:hypothetical protein